MARPRRIRDNGGLERRGQGRPQQGRQCGTLAEVVQMVARGRLIAARQVQSRGSYGETRRIKAATAARLQQRQRLVGRGSGNSSSQNPRRPADDGFDGRCLDTAAGMRATRRGSSRRAWSSSAEQWLAGGGQRGEPAAGRCMAGRGALCLVDFSSVPMYGVLDFVL